MNIAIGTYDNLSAENYHLDPALSHSGAVKLLDECPARFRHGKEEDDETDVARELEFGRAAHLLLLQPELFHSKTQVIAGENYRKKLSQELRENARAEGLIPLLSREVGILAAMEAAVRRDPDAGPLIAGGRAETSVFWRDSTFGIMRKARFDFLTGTTILDLKTCLSAHEIALGRAAYRDRWFSQDPWYREAALSAGIAVNDFIFIAVEKTPPYIVSCHRLKPSAVQRGHLRNLMAVKRFADCLSSGTWPGYGTGIRYLDLPGYADFQLEDEVARDGITAADVDRASAFLAPLGVN